MNFKATNIKTVFTEDGKQEIILTLSQRVKIDSLKQIIEKGKELVVEVKEYRKKRSLDSNSYAWLLISKIADILSTSKEEVYIEMLKKYGQHEKQLVSVIAEAVDMIYRATDNHCHEVGESELNGKLFKHLRILIGSSQYDSKEMSIFVDGIVQDAQEMGIETLTPNQILEMNSKWRVK